MHSGGKKLNEKISLDHFQDENYSCGKEFLAFHPTASISECVINFFYIYSCI